MKIEPTQFLLRLEQTVIVERSVSLVCIPDRDTAECELTQLRAKHGPRLVKAVIRKDRRPARATGSGTSRYYTLRYTIKQTEVRSLF